MDRLMLKVENVSKRYRLGQIDRTTLREEILRWNSKIHHEKEPAQKFRDENPADKTFLALENITFDVEYGEKLGIIGHNGAGKSTLLKLISRITAPTEGDIWIDGRVASVLEVGAGFNGELTGKENIYLKGAILGMKKKEIDAKIEDIIDFSECREFINTPVKRYSSGMYVKLAFSVAAYLDAELMIMDEVLAVGDMSFRKKCLDKMDELSGREGRTILHVSHNMNNIRNFCDRCIVLDHGRLVFNGDVEEAVRIYMGIRRDSDKLLDLRNCIRTPEFSRRSATITELECLTSDPGFYRAGMKAFFRLGCMAEETLENVLFRIIIKDTEERPITMMTTDKGVRLSPSEEMHIRFTLDISHLVPGNYSLTIILYQTDGLGTDIKLDMLKNVYCFDIVQSRGFSNNMEWVQRRWGYIYNEPIEYTID